MLNKTSLLAIRTLILVGQSPPRTCLSPRQLAEALGESQTYLAKVCRLLVKAGILKAQKGIKGGVWLNRDPSEVTLRAVIEACQGTIVGDYCNGDFDPGSVCAFHQAAMELHEAITGVLGKWSLAHLLERPRPVGAVAERAACLMVAREAAAPAHGILPAIG